MQGAIPTNIRAASNETCNFPRLKQDCGSIVN
jgi:hypothetical protein